MSILNCIPARIILCIMTFFQISWAQAMRICLSVAITEMVTKHPQSTLGNHCKEFPHYFGGPTKRGTNVFDWSETHQGIILSSFFWGYLISHLPAGVWADKYGGKWVLGIGNLGASILTFFTPLTIEMGGSISFIILRFTMGLFCGVSFPALSCLLAYWVPKKERGLLGSFVLGGVQLGAISASMVSGELIYYYGTWEPVFYFWGVTSFVFDIFFLLLCTSSPSSHHYITPSEKEYLESEIQQLSNKNKLPVPWMHIITSGPMIALLVAEIGHAYAFYLINIYLPKYMADVLKVDIQDNGIFSGLPYVLMGITSLFSGTLNDYLVRNAHMSVTNARKIFTTFAGIGPGIFMMTASYAGCDTTLVVASFVLAMGTMGPYNAGVKINSMDLSPNYAGTLMAIGNGISAASGIIVPFIVAYMTPNASLEEWRNVFWSTLIMLVLSCIYYIIFGSGEVQPWDEPDKLG